MKKVCIYDQYTEILSEDGTTVLYPSSGYTFTLGEYNSQEEAYSAVENIYNEAKTLGEYEDKCVYLDRGYAELKISFSDGRKLNRVIYVE